MLPSTVPRVSIGHGLGKEDSAVMSHDVNVHLFQLRHVEHGHSECLALAKTLSDSCSYGRGWLRHHKVFVFAPKII